MDLTSAETLFYVSFFVFASLSGGFVGAWISARKFETVMKYLVADVLTDEQLREVMEKSAKERRL